MKVRSLYPSAAVRYDAASEGSERGSPSSRERISPSSQRPQLRAVTDAFVLSKQARSVLEEMRRQPDVDAGIRSGLKIDQLSARRTYEVSERLEGGYYEEPRVLRVVASSVSRALASDS